jgi:ferredoxin-thioredoxin reductase catalytic subunit/rubredoxin
MSSLRSSEDIENYYLNLKEQIEASGYHFSPDEEFVKELLESILLNKDRYGYGACPCRLASGNKEEDLDIICPCDYRDQDLGEFDACYCGLYVSGKILTGEKKFNSIPERRPGPDERAQNRKVNREVSSTLAFPVWRCRVCGYLCARDSPPIECPICKVGKERFEKFM